MQTMPHPLPGQSFLYKNSFDCARKIFFKEVCYCINSNYFRNLLILFVSVNVINKSYYYRDPQAFLKGWLYHLPLCLFLRLFISAALILVRNCNNPIRIFRARKYLAYQYVCNVPYLRTSLNIENLETFFTLEIFRLLLREDFRGCSQHHYWDPENVSSVCCRCSSIRTAANP